MINRGTAIGIGIVVLVATAIAFYRIGNRRSDLMSARATVPTAAIERSRPQMDVEAPAGTETATFALGWFWGPDSRFGSLPGVIRTRVGYAGGSTENPSYHNLDGHSETIQIEYDPTQISYEELLEVFWDSHNPTRESFSRQYMSIIFTHNEEQERLALETREREAAERGTVFTEIVPAGAFYLAEDYHQKYMLRNVPELLREFTAIYPDETDLVNSTAVARVNGYLGSNGSLKQLQGELNRLGLSPEAQEWLLERVSP